MTDKYHGIGGSYLVDPQTGERRLIERTHDPRDPQNETAAPVPAADAPNTQEEVSDHDDVN